MTPDTSPLCCHHCRVRFSAGASEYLTTCPECERPTVRVKTRHELIGFRLFDPLDLTDMVLSAGEVTQARPWPTGWRP